MMHDWTFEVFLFGDDTIWTPNLSLLSNSNIQDTINERRPEMILSEDGLQVVLREGIREDGG